MSGKSHARSLSIVGALAVAAVLAACGGSSTTSGSTNTSIKVSKVAVLFAGVSNNRSFGNSVYDGANAAKQQLSSQGVTVTVVPNLNSPDDYLHQGTSFAKAGYGFELWMFGGAPDQLVAVAKQFPNVTFCELGVMVPPPWPKNVCTLSGEYYDGDFLAGMIGGTISKAHHIATVEGPAFPALTTEAEDFVLGARWVDPHIKVTQLSIPSYVDVAQGQAASNSAIAAGADVLFPAIDQATQGMLLAAQSHPGTYVIPQYYDSHSLAPNVVVTTVLLGIDGMTKSMINLGVKGQISNHDYHFKYAQAGVGKLAPYYNFSSLITPSLQARLSAAEAMLTQGTLTVPFIGTPGQGASYDLSQLPPLPAG